ncbi:Benzoate carboxyl methyltransferase [Sesamum angolense]|uniref:Benzoate carboxyl methyltransferase n=1 Tax=Sesamum angolense TaxID=2727404 RepID=A0AAE2BTF9_9LAMI|nr:Benzoate carboxyl methyltransferase [Sesamum angolense]
MFLRAQQLFRNLPYYQQSPGAVRREQLWAIACISVFLNDLPGNDFNNLFKMLPTFYQKLNQLHNALCVVCLALSMAGYFKQKLGLCLFILQSPVLSQYQKDFSIFLSSRGEEMAPGGRMVLTFVGRSVADPSSKDGAVHFTLLADTLLDMINEGLIKEADLHSFNMPIYTPSKQEVEAAILSEGSFTLYKLEDFLVPWDAHVEHSNSNNHRPDKYRRGELVSAFIRAYTEPILATHFGTSVMDDLYTRYAKKLAEYLSVETPTYFIHVVSLSKK